jgi:hypothetical protein
MRMHDLIERHGVQVDPHLSRDVAVPVAYGLQRQGDVIVIPAATSDPATTPVARQGFPVVRGEAGGNTHLLLADGGVFYDPASNAGQELGTLTVGEGATAYLAHPEHGYAGIAPGTYVIRRQREQAEQIRLVAD